MSALDLLGSSLAVAQLRDQVSFASKCDAKVLIVGESGVGKEIVARLIHDQSGRSSRFITCINCAGVLDSLLESELFGHVRGSFTGAFRDKPGLLAQAHGGTVFMDEIGEMSPRMQSVLLRFLDTGEIQRVGSDRIGPRLDVRIIAATNRDLMQAMRTKEFRDDLYYRLNVVHIAIPPLRQRREDIPSLLRHFLASYAETHAIQEPVLTCETTTCLETYHWPGNIRELRNVAEVLVISRRPTILPQHLPGEIVGRTQPCTSGSIARTIVQELYDRVTKNHESFWAIVYEPFIARDLTREELRGIIRLGLEESKGNYKVMMRLFGLEQRDYARFLKALRRHDCHLPFSQFRHQVAAAFGPHRPK